MKKVELAGAVAESTGLQKKDAVAAVEAVFDIIANQVRSGDDVTVGGFGTFHAKTRNAREGRNPATGETIQIPEKTSIALKPVTALRDLKNAAA